MDCYLCGASNPPDADFCERCDGQLLKIGLDPEPVEEVVEPDEPVVPEDDAEEPTTRSSTRRRPSLRSIEHKRLQDALGLGDDDDTDDEGDDASSYVDAQIVPKAGPASGIPMIGARAPAGSRPGGVTTRDSSRTVYVLLGMLFAAVLWMAYTTLLGGRDDGIPDNLALTNTTLPRDTTPESAPGPRPWTATEVGGRFGPTFVRITLIDCPEERIPGTATPLVEERDIYGVTVNQHSVMFPSAALGTADVASIRSRFGNRAAARLQVLTGGVAVATTDRVLNRTLSLVESPIGQNSYYVSYDDETATTTVTNEPGDVPIEVQVTNQGEATAVRIDDVIVDLDALLEIATFRVEALEDPEPPRGRTICDEAPFLADATPTEQPETEISDE